MTMRKIKYLLFGILAINVSIIVCLLSLLHVKSAYSHAIYPRQVSVEVYGREKDNAVNYVVVKWQQVSQANEACISKHRGDDYILIGCQNTNMGMQQFSTRKYVDGMYKHVDGDVYFITEYINTQAIQYGPYEGKYTYYIMITR